MSGHSKWSNIKHKKEKTDAAKAKVFTKIGKEIRRYFAENSEVTMIPVQIRRCIKVDECIQNEQTLYEYAPDSTAAEDYMRLAEYILGLPVQPRKKSNPQIWGSKANAAYEQFIKEREEN